MFKSINKTIWMLVLSVFIMIGCGDDATKKAGKASDTTQNTKREGQPGEQDDTTKIDCSDETVVATGIGTKENLEKIGKDDAYPLGASYKLTEDITLTEDWTPIGTKDKPFTGNFYGCGKTISGLNINKSTASHIGFFGHIGNDGETGDKIIIKDLTIVVTTISGKQYVGALAGLVYNTSITNVHITDGTIKGKKSVGGLVGQIDKTTITSSYVTGDVTAEEDYVGGLVGYAANSTITSSYAKGNVDTKNNYAGGLVGGVGDCSITSSYATGTVKGATLVGGFVGSAAGTTIRNSYATGKVTGSSVNNIGGLVGWAPESTITSSYFDTVGTGQTVGVGRNTGTPQIDVTGITEGSITLTTFTGARWLDTIWNFVAGTWPTLKWQTP